MSFMRSSKYKDILSNIDQLLYNFLLEEIDSNEET